MKDISLALIVKYDKEELSHALEAINSIKSKVKEVVVDINSTSPEEIVIPEEFKQFNVKATKWENDFSKARNNLFSRVKTRWVIWMDADDIFLGGDNLDKVIDYGELNNVSGFFTEYIYQLDKYGNVLEKHKKLQIMDIQNYEGKWNKKIHEDYSFTAGRVQFTPFIQRVHKYGGEHTHEKMLRNLRMLTEELIEEGDNPDPRTLIYTAKSYMGIGDNETAEPLLMKYLELSGWDDEIYEARLLLAEIYKDKLSKRREHLKEAIFVKPEYPDAYYEMADTYIKEENYARAIEYLKTGFTKKVPEFATTTFVDKVTWRPLAMYAYCLLNQAKFNEALRVAEKARNLGGLNEVNNLIDLIIKVKSKRETATHYVKIVKYLEQNNELDKIPILLSSVPTAVKDDPAILSIQFNYLPPKKWGEKDIVYYCPRSVEPWSPNSLSKGGIGGSETAVINLAKEWAKKGYNVTVYNWCSTDEGVYDGVRYENFWKFNWKDEFNVLISWRYPELYDLDISAKMAIVDMHDTMTPALFNEKRLSKIDKVFVKTNSHKILYPNVPEDKFVTINNGLDMSRFSSSQEKEPHRMIYSSCPSRGLEYVVDMMPEIRKQVPDAELHIFYGWNTFYELEKHNPERVAWMKQLQEKVETTNGIVNHGRVSQNELAKQFLKSAIWAYPTDFYEISCITAMEAQAAETMPITIAYGALPETIRFGEVIEGDITNPETKKEWLEKIIHYLKHPKDREERMNGAREYVEKELSWEFISNNWINKIEEYVKNN